MAIQINGTSGISGVDGSAGTPALQGSDSNTGISFGTDTVNINTGGTTRATVDSSGRVGIGTSTPSTNTEINAALDTGASLGLNEGQLSIGREANSGGALRIGYDTTNNFGFISSGRVGTSWDKLVLNAGGGNVGIGTTSPARGPLHVHATSGESHLHLTNADTGSTGGDGFSLVAMTSTDNNEAWLIQRENAAMRFYTNSFQRASIDSSGRLLVGTSSASSGAPSGGALIQGSGSAAGPLTLQVDATPAAAGTDIGLVRFTNSAGGLGAQIKCVSDGSWTNGSNHRSRLEFSTTADGASSPTERMRIGQNGFTKISNSGIYNDATGLYHEIMTNLTGYHALLCRAPASYSSSTIKSYVLTAAGTGFNHFNADSNGTVVCVIRGDGNLLNVNNSYGALSDIKLKENVVDANSQWNDLKALKVRNYNFKEGQTHTQIGLVAQEVELVSPGLVSESPDRDEDGNDLGTVTKSVNYSVLYMKAVKALQEAMERIESLETRLTALEGGTNP